MPQRPPDWHATSGDRLSGTLRTRVRGRPRRFLGRALDDWFSRPAARESSRPKSLRSTRTSLVATSARSGNPASFESRITVLVLLLRTWNACSIRASRRRTWGKARDSVSRRHWPSERVMEPPPFPRRFKTRAGGWEDEGALARPISQRWHQRRFRSESHPKGRRFKAFATRSRCLKVSLSARWPRPALTAACASGRWPPARRTPTGAVHCIAIRRSERVVAHSSGWTRHQMPCMGGQFVHTDQPKARSPILAAPCTDDSKCVQYGIQPGRIFHVTPFTDVHGQR